MQSRLIRHPSKVLIRLRSPPADTQRPENQPTGESSFFFRLHKRFVIIEGKLSGHEWFRSHRRVHGQTCWFSSACLMSQPGGRPAVSSLCAPAVSQRRCSVRATVKICQRRERTCSRKSALTLARHRRGSDACELLSGKHLVAGRHHCLLAGSVGGRTRSQHHCATLPSREITRKAND